MTGRALHALLLPPGHDLLDALRRARDGGPAILPLDPALPRRRVTELLAALRPHAVVEPGPTVTRLADPAPCPDDVALVLPTSGTTGAAKAVELTAAALRASATASLATLGATPADRWLCCLPTHHIAGAQVLLRALELGGTPIIHDRFRPEAVAGCAYDFTALVPTMLHRLLGAGRDLAARPDPDAGGGVLVGGARLPAPLRRRAEAAGVRCVETYGMTETSGGCVYDGRPLPGVQVRLDRHGRILLRGPVLARGYRLRPELTAASLVDGWLRTEDAGVLAPDGRLEVVGRLDDMIVCGGRNIFPGPVEALLSEHPGVAEVAVVARPDPEWGQVAVACVVPRGIAPTLADLRAHVTERAETWLAPHVLMLRNHLPRTRAGKIDRRALRRWAITPAPRGGTTTASTATTASRGDRMTRGTGTTQVKGESNMDWKSSGDYEDIIYETAEGIAKITINRPERRNAFRPTTLFELQHAFTVARDDPGVGVVIFTGAGTDAFCSGGDQKIRGDDGYLDAHGVGRLNVLDLQVQIRRLPKPVIAMVAGYAIGGGHILHLCCDLTIAADNARFGQTGPIVGSFDGGYGAWLLAETVGLKRAREIWYLCRQYDAQQALAMGLINTVVPVDLLEEETVAWAREMLAKSPLALRMLKGAINAVSDGAAGMQQFAGDATLLYYMSEEAQEGRDAFVQKRPPDFSRFPRRP